MEQRGFLFNPNRCLGCRSCQVACAINHGLPPGVFLRKVTEIEFIRDKQIVKYYLSSSCNHCQNPECFRNCPEHAYQKRRDGIVVQDQSRCKGCGTCTRSCPFQAPVINPLTSKVTKCDFCHGRIEEDENPFCVASCPVDALQLLNLSTGIDIVLKLQKELPGVPRIQLTRPSVRYIPLQLGRQVGLQVGENRGDEHN